MKGNTEIDTEPFHRINSLQVNNKKAGNTIRLFYCE